MMNMTVILEHEHEGSSRIERSYLPNVESIRQNGEESFEVTTYGNDPVTHTIGQRDLVGIKVTITD